MAPMQRKPRSGSAAILSWLIGIGVAVVVLPPVARLFGAGLFRLLPLALLLVALCLAAIKLGWLPARPARRDPLDVEEEERRARLDELRRELEEMEVTLRDLRDLRVHAEDEVRARWAELELEQALDRARAAMAEERALLAQLGAVRWLTALEPLVSRPPGADDPSEWLTVLPGLRDRGRALLDRLEADGAAVETETGAETARLVGEALQELEALNAELLARRAAFLAREPRSDASVSRPSASGERLESLLQRARAWREVRSWSP